MKQILLIAPEEPILLHKEANSVAQGLSELASQSRMDNFVKFLVQPAVICALSLPRNEFAFPIYIP